MLIDGADFTERDNTSQLKYDWIKAPPKYITMEAAHPIG